MGYKTSVLHVWMAEKSSFSHRTVLLNNSASLAEAEMSLMDFEHQSGGAYLLIVAS